MTPDQEARLEYLEGIVNRFMLQDRYYAEKNFQFADGRNVLLGGTTGTSIGNSTSKLSFYGVTPVARQSLVTAPTSAGGVYSQSVAQTNVDATNQIITRLKNLGLTA